MPEANTNKVLAVIPARYAAQRLPGKPLALIDGKPMILHVLEKALAAKGLDRVIVATDDQRIVDVVEAAGGQAQLTRPEHPSGTDRVWEVASQLPEYELIMNIQGDEPMIDPTCLSQVVAAMASSPEADIMTPVTPISPDEWPQSSQNPNIVKAILRKSGEVLYFSRAPIPFERDPNTPDIPCYRHLGIYLYRREAIMTMTSLPPSALELTEKLEQLRAMENGLRIDATVVQKVSIGVDTLEDLQHVERLIQAQSV